MHILALFRFVFFRPKFATIPCILLNSVSKGRTMRWTSRLGVKFQWGVTATWRSIILVVQVHNPYSQSSTTLPPHTRKWGKDTNDLKISGCTNSCLYKLSWGGGGWNRRPLGSLFAASTSNLQLRLDQTIFLI